jgi:hypothetical protein
MKDFYIKRRREMNNIFENRYWKMDEYKGMVVGKLHFKQYYDDEVILGFQQDKDDENLFWYVSDLLNVEQDCITSDSIEDAIEEFESMIIDYIDEKITELEDIKNKFNELVVQ